MEYRRKRRASSRRKASGRAAARRSSSTSSDAGRAIVSLLMVGAIVYLVSASAAGTWIAENVMAPMISAFQENQWGFGWFAKRKRHPNAGWEPLHGG